MEFSPTQTATGSMSSAPKAMRRSSSTFSANTFIKSKTPSQPDSPVTATPPAPVSLIMSARSGLIVTELSLQFPDLPFQNE